MVDLPLEIRQVEFPDLRSLKHEAIKARLSFKESRDTVWFGAYLGNELIGCAGVCWLNKEHSKARPKSYFILPEWRKQGYGRLLNIERMRWLVEDTDVKVIDAYPKRSQVPVWVKLGFDIIKEPHEWGARKWLVRKVIERPEDDA